MNKFTQRILIANDVIMRINSGHLIPHQGSLLSLTTKHRLRCNDENSCAELQSAVKALRSCEACANGLLLLAHIARFDSVSPFALQYQITYDNIHKESPISKYFGSRLINEIECAYEGKVFGWHFKMSPNEIKRISAFRKSVLGVTSSVIPHNPLVYKLYLSAEDRKKMVLAIMQRIIDNDGKKLIL